MKAMILAAGEGRRLRPLTASVPKPLLSVGGCRLIEHNIQRCVAAGIKEIVINTGYLGHMLPEVIGDGRRWGVCIEYSVEPEQTPLETGGGIAQALSLLGTDPFVVLSADIWCDFSLSAWQDLVVVPGQMHLGLVPAVGRGDFGFAQQGQLTKQGDCPYWFAGIAVVTAAAWADFPLGRYPLKVVLDQAMQRQQLTGQLIGGHWFNVGDQTSWHALHKHLGIATYSVQ